jgi:riboflavin kinase/FMN adenylyltransferase
VAGSIERIPSCDALPEALRGGVVAIGNFDGVHRGHQAVLEAALSVAAKRGLPSLVLTFEPHPRSFLRPAEPVDRLTPAPLKARLLAALGFDAVVEQPFDAAFAGQSPSDFVEKAIVSAMSAAHVVTGFDFHFGRGRLGGPAFLMESAKANGFAVTLVEAFRDEAAEVVSSSRIRSLLAEGDVGQAAGLLGYRYTIESPIVHGRKLGRTLGYPTANMALPSSVALAHGIYAVRLRRADGSLHDGVASFGRRPTIDDHGAPLLETFVFDFAGDLYGEVCSVSLFGYLRGEVKFDGLDPLVAQMKRDEEEARALLSKVTPLSALDAAITF